MNSCHAICDICEEEIDWESQYCKICKEVNKDLIEYLNQSSNKSWAELNEVIYKDVQDIYYLAHFTTKCVKNDKQPNTDYL